jgi:ubiquinone/menaquinone biosynthesis C-methylase UbiE
MNTDFAREPESWIEGIPCFLESVPPDRYGGKDLLDPEIYFQRYQQRSGRRQIYQSLLLDDLPAGARVLSAAEGTGEVVVALAEKYPELQFYAFDITTNRVVLAIQLARRVGVENVSFYIGSVADLPFRNGFFSGVIERGIFHTLPVEVKKQNLAEIERTCRGTVILDWMTRNAMLYILRQWCRSVYFRDRQTWLDSVATYRNIDKRYGTMSKLARLIESETGHSVRTLRSFIGDRELEEERPSPFAFLESVGGLVYATTD